MNDFIYFFEQADNYTNFLFLFLAIVLGCNIANWIFFRNILNFLGIYPRSFFGLIGIFFAPFLHGSLTHYMSNAMAFFCMEMIIIFLLGPEKAIALSMLLCFLSGILTWCFGRKAFHIGASSMISGLFSWIVYWAFHDPSIFSFFIVFFILLYFGTIILGVIPTTDGTSWESHLFGLLSGVFVAKHPYYLDISLLAYWNITDWIATF